MHNLYEYQLINVNVKWIKIQNTSQRSDKYERFISHVFPSIYIRSADKISVLQ